MSDEVQTESVNDEDLGYSDEELQGAEEPQAQVESEQEEAVPEPEQKESGIPPGVLAEQRRQYAEIKRENQQLRDEYLSQLEQLRQERKEQNSVKAAPAPDPDEDPIGYLRYQQESSSKQTKEQLEMLNQQILMQKQQEDQQKQYQQFINNVTQQEQEFSKTNPDYNDALEHYREVNAKRYMALGFPEAEAKQQVVQQEINEAALAMQYGQNPAEYIYNISKSFGYSGKAKESTKKLDSMEKGKKAQSLGPSGLPDVEDLVDMDDNEFHEFTAAFKELGLKH